MSYKQPVSCSRFRKPPLSSRTVGFPESGWQQQLFPKALPSITRCLSAYPHTPRLIRFDRWLDRFPSEVGIVLSDISCPARVSFGCPLFTESPFAFVGCYPLKSHVYHNLNRHYPALFALTGLCAGPDSSTALSSHPKRRSLQVAVSPCCNQVLPGVNPSIFLHVQASLPRLLLWCIYPFLPTRQRPSRHPNPVGADASASMAMVHTAISVWRLFSRLQ